MEKLNRKNFWKKVYGFNNIRSESYFKNWNNILSSFNSNKLNEFSDVITNSVTVSNNELWFGIICRIILKSIIIGFLFFGMTTLLYVFGDTQPEIVRENITSMTILGFMIYPFFTLLFLDRKNLLSLQRKRLAYRTFNKNKIRILPKLAKQCLGVKESLLSHNNKLQDLKKILTVTDSNELRQVIKKELEKDKFGTFHLDPIFLKKESLEQLCSNVLGLTDPPKKSEDSVAVMLPTIGHTFISMDNLKIDYVLFESIIKPRIEKQKQTISFLETFLGIIKEEKEFVNSATT